MSYSFHLLINLSKDAFKYGYLDNFSAFKYENYLYSLKRKINKGNSILPQLSNRIIEESFCLNCLINLKKQSRRKKVNHISK